MTNDEFDTLMKKLIDEGKCQCPLCKEGTVIPYGKNKDPKTCRFWVCDKCNFRITGD